MNYNGVKIGDEDPFVGINNEIIVYGGKRCAIKRISIQGKIYGSGKNKCNTDILSEIQSFSQAVIDDYKSFSVGGFSAQYARCESLSITNSNAFGAEYQAEFLAYPDEWFSDIIGVLDPVDSVKIVENKNGTISITRNVSGRGITSDELGIYKVYEWIQSLNIQNILDNKILQIADSKNININVNTKPSRISQTINRLDGTVNTDVEFNFNLNSTSQTMLNISVDISYDSEIGVYNATLNGNLSGPIGMTMDTLRNQLNSIPFYNYVSNQMPENTPALDIEPASKNIDENQSDISINFTYTYNTLIGTKLIKSTTTIEHDLVKDIKSINLQGTVVLNKKSQYEKNLQKNTLLDDIDFNKVAMSEYSKFFEQGISSNIKLSTKVPKSYSISLNDTDITANYNISYDDSSIIDPSLNLPEDIYSFDYQISYTPSIYIKLPLQFIPGNQGIMDLKAKRRGALSINGTALAISEISKENLLSAVEVLAERIKNSEKFNNVHIERKICNYFMEADTVFKYSFELSMTAETKLYTE